MLNRILGAIGVAIIGGIGYIFGGIYPVEKIVGCTERLTVQRADGPNRYVPVWPIKNSIELHNNGDAVIQVSMKHADVNLKQVPGGDLTKSPSTATQGDLKANGQAKFKLEQGEFLSIFTSQPVAVFTVVKLGLLGPEFYETATNTPCRSK